MSTSPSDSDPSLESRQTVFQALVDAQDEGLTVAASRAAVVQHFSLTEDQVKEIEKEGLAKQWPPL